MQLYIENIAKVKKADIDINGITVIAGPNNTGKSTVGKALFSIFSSFYDIKRREKAERVRAIASVISSLLFMVLHYDDRHSDNIINKLAEAILDAEVQDRDLNAFVDTLIRDFVYSNVYSKQEEDEHVEITQEDINKIVEKAQEVYSLKSEVILQKIFQRSFNSEFDGQVSTIGESTSKGRISLTVKDKSAFVTIDDNEIINIDSDLDIRTQAIYIDDPYMLDSLSIPYFALRHQLAHQQHLRSKLFNFNEESSIVNEIIIEQSIAEIYATIDRVCNGSIAKSKGRLVYTRNNSSQSFNVKNLSAGLKTFVIIKTLLLNEVICEKGTIILDEPEIHLHPEWQLVFAELIVLLQKQFDLHILLTTHSPYFLRAIQVYSAKHELADKCKYYLSRIEGHDAYVDDVSDDIEKIYASLVRPFQELENEEWS